MLTGKSLCYYYKSIKNASILFDIFCLRAASLGLKALKMEPDQSLTFQDWEGV